MSGTARAPLAGIDAGQSIGRPTSKSTMNNNNFSEAAE